MALKLESVNIMPMPDSFEEIGPARRDRDGAGLVARSTHRNDFQPCLAIGHEIVEQEPLGLQSA